MTEMDMRIFAAAFVVISIVIVLILLQPPSQTANDVEQDPQIGRSEQPRQAYSLNDVAAHDSQDDCWIVLNDRVYDVTAFIASHPGGNAILAGCGKDATDLYETRPMGSGSPHSSRARGLLEEYYVGGLE